MTMSCPIGHTNSFHCSPLSQVKMLQALGLKSTLITDGNSPINLFNTAQGLLGVKAPTVD